MSSKYKVGQEVRVKSLEELKALNVSVRSGGDLIKKGTNWMFVEPMYCTCGNKYIIKFDYF